MKFNWVTDLVYLGSIIFYEPPWNQSMRIVADCDNMIALLLKHCDLLGCMDNC